MAHNVLDNFCFAIYGLKQFILALADTVWMVVSFVLESKARPSLGIGWAVQLHVHCRILGLHTSVAAVFLL